MASVTQNSSVPPHLLSSIGTQAAELTPRALQKPRDITATFHYYKDNADGSPPEPNYVDRPAGYYREPISQELIVHDIRGSEDQYTLDTTGFQVVKHKSVEKDFLDDEQIKAQYYQETEELLKKA